MIFFHDISVRLFHDKKCCNCINLFPYTLWDLFVMGLVLSGEYLIKIAKGHIRNTCRKVNSQARCPAQYSLSRRLSCDLDSWLAPITSDPRSSHVLLEIVNIRIPITHTIYTLIIHRNGKEPIKRKKP